MIKQIDKDLIALAKYIDDREARVEAINYANKVLPLPHDALYKSEGYADIIDAFLEAKKGCYGKGTVKSMAVAWSSILANHLFEKIKDGQSSTESPKLEYVFDNFLSEVNKIEPNNNLKTQTT